LHQAGSRKFLDPNDTNAVISYGPPTTELPSTNVDSINQALIIKAKRKLKKPKTTAEEVNQILTDDQSTTPGTDATTPKQDDNVIGPKPEDNKAELEKRALEDKAKKAMDAKNASTKTKKDASDKKNPSDKNKKEASDKKTSADKNKKTTSTVIDKKDAKKPKQPEPAKKKEAVKNKNKNDFSDEFK
jgi:hypothetical protein